MAGFFIWLNRISLYFGIYLHRYIYRYIYIFPYSIYGHSSCFYVLVIVNNTKMGMSHRYLFKLIFQPLFFLLGWLDNVTN